MTNKILVGSVISVSLLVFAVAAFWYSNQQQHERVTAITEGQAQLVRDHSPTRGSPLYRVTLVEFLDPECESCRIFHPVVKQLLQKYENRIYYVVRYAPFHKYSVAAVAFLEAARQQGKYWQTLDLLFERQPEWADHHNPKPELKWTYIDELGLSEEKMRQDVDAPEVQKIIELDMKDGRRLQVTGTPTFFINGRLLQRLGPEQLDQAIQKALEGN